MSPANTNVVSLLELAADRTPARAALISARPPGSISFAELWQRVDAASTALGRAGLEPGQRAVCMAPMSIDLYVCLLALLKLGAVAVFVDPWISARQIAAFAAYASPSAFIGVPKSHILRLLHPTLRRMSLTVTTGRRTGRFTARLRLAELLAAHGDGRIHAPAPGDSALITFTSGSSGTPKGADRTHAFLAAQHSALRTEFPYYDSDVDMPMFPVFALNNLAWGITSVIPDMDFRAVSRVEPAAILDQLERHGVTTCTASPPFFDRLAAHLREAPDRRPPLRRILTGGAPVSNRQLRLWQEAFGDTETLVVYGSTEAEPVAHISAQGRLAARSMIRPRSSGYCVGTPVGAVRTRLVRIHPGPIALEAGGWEPWTPPPGEIGELVVTGSHVCKGYYNNPDAVAENKIMDPDGVPWHRMGDTGYFDGGRFWIVGRVHSTIFRNGTAVHPQLVEQASSALLERGTAAVGVRDKALGERVVLVVHDPSGSMDPADARARLASIEHPVDDVVVSRRAFPTDPRHNAKVNYRALKRRLTARRRRRGRM